VPSISVVSTRHEGRQTYLLNVLLVTLKPARTSLDRVEGLGEGGFELLGVCACVSLEYDTRQRSVPLSAKKALVSSRSFWVVRLLNEYLTTEETSVMYEEHKVTHGG
jgi:hypothetical protein